LNHEFPLIKTQKSVSSSTVKKIRLQYIDQVLQVFQTIIGVDSDSHRKGILVDSDSHRKGILVDSDSHKKGILVDSDSHRKGILADSDSHRKVILVDWQVVVKGSRQERRERRRI